MSRCHIWHRLRKLAQFERRLAKRMCTREAEDHKNGVVDRPESAFRDEVDEARAALVPP